jgi:hypothetical protein
MLNQNNHAIRGKLPYLEAWQYQPGQAGGNSGPIIGPTRPEPKLARVYISGESTLYHWQLNR